MDRMKTENKVLIGVLSLALLTVVFSGYYHFFIVGDYDVTKQISCDPQIESCFVSDCEANDANCDPTTTYKKISVLSKYAGIDYDSLSCAPRSSFCKIIMCADDTVEAGEKCFE